MPFVPIPLGGVGREDVVRSMVDLDAWITSTSQGQSYALGGTREVLWETVMEATWGGDVVHTAPYTCTLPIGLFNTRERSTDSPAFACPIPARIPALTQQQEEAVICKLLSELNASYEVGLDPSPSFDRCVEPGFTVHRTERTVFGSGLHMHNITGVLTTASKDVIDLLFRGWRTTKANIDKLASSIAALKLTDSDTVFFDFCSNSAYMGTDRNGLPAAAEKMLDGKHHLQGDLQTAPRQVFCRIIKDCTPVLEASAAAAVVLMAPTPGYVKSGCCDNPDHVSNIDSSNDLFEDELQLALTHFRTAVASLPVGQISRFFDVYRQLLNLTVT